MKKLIEIPDKIFTILKEHKQNTGRSMIGIIQEAITRYLVHERLLNFKRKTLIQDQNGDLYFEEEIKK